MNVLVINTLEQEDKKVSNEIEKIKTVNMSYKIINTSELEINHCMGCYCCWCDTPGKCVINDDIENITIDFLKAEEVIFIADMHLGFLNSSCKAVIDRLLFPSLVIHKCFKNGEIRSINRYNKSWKVSLLYKGVADEKYINHWLSRVCENMHSISLGAKKIG